MLSLGYRFGVAVRNCLFDWDVKGVHRTEVPVVSVGNITTGGTGKTPLVAFLANWFQIQKARPAILSRGYRSVDGVANDEKLVLDQLCRGVPHLQNPDRVASAKRAVMEHRAGVLILDDGFQHRRLARDLDIVLIDATCPFGYGAILPRGLLREPLSSLSRADFAVITRADHVSEAERLEIKTMIQKHHPELPIAEVAFVPMRLVNAEGAVSDFDAFREPEAIAFCGIGNPAGFEKTLANGGFEISAMRTFADHHHYTADELETIGELAQKANAPAIFTTQKDLVKIPQTALGGVPLWAVEIGVEWMSGEAELLVELDRVANAAGL